MRISVEQFASVSSNEYDGRKCFQILHNLLHAVYGTSRTAEQNADVNFAANLKYMKRAWGIILEPFIM
jgi:hypothetical protein